MRIENKKLSIFWLIIVLGLSSCGAAKKRSAREWFSDNYTGKRYEDERDRTDDGNAGDVEIIDGRDVLFGSGNELSCNNQLKTCSDYRLDECLRDFCGFGCEIEDNECAAIGPCKNINSCSDIDLESECSENECCLDCQWKNDACIFHDLTHGVLSASNP